MCTKPGLTVCTCTPRGRSSLATEREKPSCACFEAEYGPIATVPATETTLTRCAGAAASSAGRKREQAPDRAEVVRPDELLDPLGREVEEVPASRHARVVHEQAHSRDGAHAPTRPSGRPPRGRRRRRPRTPRRSRRRCLQAILAPAHEHAAPASLGQPAGEGRADPGRSAGDDGYLHTRTMREATTSGRDAESTTARSRCRPCRAVRDRQVAL